MKIRITTLLLLLFTACSGGGGGGGGGTTGDPAADGGTTGSSSTSGSASTGGTSNSDDTASTAQPVTGVYLTGRLDVKNADPALAFNRKLELKDSSDNVVVSAVTDGAGHYKLLAPKAVLTNPNGYKIFSLIEDDGNGKAYGVTQPIDVSTYDPVKSIADQGIAFFLEISAIRGQAKFLDENNNVISDLDPTKTEVFLPGFSFFARTDSEGRFLLLYIPAGGYELRIDNGTLVYKMPVTVEKETTLNLGIILIKRDVAGPTNVNISADKLNTQGTTVNLALSATDAVEMYITNTVSCLAGGKWEKYATSRTNWALPNNNATNHIYAQFRDDVGNVSACVSTAVIQDTIGPTAPDFSFRSSGWSAVGGGLLVTDPVIVFQIFRPSVGEQFSEFRYSTSVTNPATRAGGATCDGDVSNGTWEPTSYAEFNVTLSPGVNYLSVEGRDLAGNRSTCTVQLVELDTATVTLSNLVFTSTNTVPPNGESHNLPFYVTTDSSVNYSYSLDISLQPSFVASSIAYSLRGCAVLQNELLNPHYNSWISPNNSISLQGAELALTKVGMVVRDEFRNISTCTETAIYYYQSGKISPILNDGLVTWLPNKTPWLTAGNLSSTGWWVLGLDLAIGSTTDVGTTTETGTDGVNDIMGWTYQADGVNGVYTTANSMIEGNTYYAAVRSVEADGTRGAAVTTPTSGTLGFRYGNSGTLDVTAPSTDAGVATVSASALNSSHNSEGTLACGSNGNDVKIWRMLENWSGIDTTFAAGTAGILTIAAASGNKNTCKDIKSNFALISIEDATTHAPKGVDIVKVDVNGDLDASFASNHSSAAFLTDGSFALGFGYEPSTRTITFATGSPAGWRLFAMRETGIIEPGWYLPSDLITPSIPLNTGGALTLGGQYPYAAAVFSDGKTRIYSQASDWRDATPKAIINGSSNSLGYITVDREPGVNDTVTGIALTSNGSLLVTGGQSTIRFTKKAVADTTFGTSGRATHTYSSMTYTVNGMVLQGNEKAVFYGTNGAGNMAVFRLKTDGTLDTTFATSGIYSVSSATPSSAWFDSDAKLIVGGKADSTPTFWRLK